MGFNTPVTIQPNPEIGLNSARRDVGVGGGSLLLELRSWTGRSSAFHSMKETFPSVSLISWNRVRIDFE